MFSWTILIYFQENHLTMLTARVRAAFDQPITAGTYSRLAGLMELSNNINTHITAMRNMPSRLSPLAATYPVPRDANLTSLPRPACEPRARSKKRPNPTEQKDTSSSNSTTLACVESRLCYEAHLAKVHSKKWESWHSC